MAKQFAVIWEIEKSYLPITKETGVNGHTSPQPEGRQL